MHKAMRSSLGLSSHVSQEQAEHCEVMRFVESIEAYCLGFAHMPERGTKRDDLRQGLRTVGFQVGLLNVSSKVADGSRRRYLGLHTFNEGHSLQVIDIQQTTPKHHAPWSPGDDPQCRGGQRNSCRKKCASN
jgi:hypothetical protein